MSYRCHGYAPYCETSYRTQGYIFGPRPPFLFYPPLPYSTNPIPAPLCPSTMPFAPSFPQASTPNFPEFYPSTRFRLLPPHSYVEWPHPYMTGPFPRMIPAQNYVTTPPIRETYPDTASTPTTTLSTYAGFPISPTRLPLSTLSEENHPDNFSIGVGSPCSELDEFPHSHRPSSTSSISSRVLTQSQEQEEDFIDEDETLLRECFTRPQPPFHLINRPPFLPIGTIEPLWFIQVFGYLNQEFPFTFPNIDSLRECGCPHSLLLFLHPITCLLERCKNYRDEKKAGEFFSTDKILQATPKFREKIGNTSVYLMLCDLIQHLDVHLEFLQHPEQGNLSLTESLWLIHQILSEHISPSTLDIPPEEYFPFIRETQGILRAAFEINNFIKNMFSTCYEATARSSPLKCS